MFRRKLKRNTTSRHAAITTSRSGLLSRLAGIPAGMRQTRRGSFLIMVVGTLALLSVITVIYVSIGRGDSQTSAAALKFDERDDVPEQVRDYIAGIIALDLFDTLYLGERDENGDPIFRREAWDYPSTAYQRLDPTTDNWFDVTAGGVVGDPNEFAWFTPTGNGTGTDPWLASSEPSLQNFDATGLTGETMPADYYLERLDWMNLSNPAPDGSFVNLYNLRGAIVNGVSRGNFDATPWEMRGYNFDSNSSTATLTLFEDSPDSSPGNRNRNRDFGGTATLSSALDALPADTTSRQRWAVYPKVEPRLDPDNPNYLLYQYADADGDGILDSRWFEMVEDRDPTDLIETQLLVHDDRLRFFIATRIIDLSGRVNVNTATDSTLAPLADDPYGLNPSAIDIRRVFTGEDAATDTRTTVGYSDHLQPNYPNNPDANDPENYEDYDTANTDNNNYYAGEKSYDALRMVLDTGMMPERGYNGLLGLAAGGVIDREFSLAAGGGMLNPYWDPYWKLTGANNFLQPSNYYSLFSGFGSGGGAGYAPGGGTIESGLGRSFGLDSLFELLTYNGVNNDTTRSSLEVALSGRGDPADFAPPTDYLAARFGPLRDNRSTDLERTRGRWPSGPGTYIFFDEAKAALYTDARQRITTHSGRRPITPSRIAAIPGTNDPDPADLPLDKDDTKRTIRDLFSIGGSGQSLFEAYANALAPYSDNQTAPGPNHWDSTTSPETDTLYYGYRGPHPAIQTAGMLAANMLDAYDTGDAPTKRTLLFNGTTTFRNTDLDDTGRNLIYPWKLLDLDANTPSGDPLRLYDSTTAIPGMPDAINVFGIEAQPFITEAASFMVYTDTPRSATDKGDVDFPLDIDGDGIDDLNLNYRPSINGDATESNPDCLFEVLAFQVHNPFDETITLSGNPSDGGFAEARRDLYYIQYGDDYYKLTEVDSITGVETSNTITLGPRDSKTFYVLSANPGRILDRINNAIDPDITIDKVNSWIDRQLGTTTDTIRVGAFDRGTGAIIIPSGSFSSLQSGDPADRRVVRLWRVEKPESDPSGGFMSVGVNEATLNDPVNDTLVDRMRDPSISRPALDRQLTASPLRAGEIENAEIGNESPSGSVDNQGITITRFASLRRRDDPGAVSIAPVPRGALPAYCLESKSQADIGSQNGSYGDGGPPQNLDINYFQGVKADKTLLDLLDKQSEDGITKLVPTVSKDPDIKREDPLNNVPGFEIGDNLNNIPFDGGMVAGNYEPPLYIEPHLNNDKFETTGGVSTMRIADLLLPLGIAPHQIPLIGGNAPSEDIEWTTLSEALAIALYYENPAAGTSVYADAFVPPLPGELDLVFLDRGFLRYDAFVPFFDDTANTMPFDPTTDTRWGLGVPAAATLFDTFTTLPPKFGSITTPTHGQININTASREVLRSLPGLSPPSVFDPDGTTPNWWWNDNITHDWRSDIATTLAAYRDRIAMFPRDTDDGVAEPIETLNFRAWWDFTSGPAVRRPPADKTAEAPGERQAELDGDNARWGTTGVMGIREGLGIRSLGEIAFLRDWGYVPDVAGYALPHDIDRLGYDGIGVNQEGIDSIVYGTTADDDQIEDDYDERLALVNTVMASSSVRSDVFAVWFIVHGYQESDVKGLSDNDPLVPSVARRFVMVVDRSNVTEPGQKPEILLFKEVPL